MLKLGLLPDLIRHEFIIRARSRFWPMGLAGSSRPVLANLDTLSSIIYGRDKQRCPEVKRAIVTELKSRRMSSIT